MPGHLEEYLNYYKGLKEPGYAVLVTGEWGIGKTHQVRRILKEDGCYYVSLFGVRTIEQLHSEVQAAIDPKLEKYRGIVEKASEAASVVGGPLSFVGAAPTLFNSMFRVNLKPDKVLVFDDLERCRLPLQDRLGAINQYVEHHGFPVVVIAHEEKVADRLLNQKEKLFGQSLEAELYLDEAFESFLKKFGNAREKHFVRTQQKLLLGTFRQSGVKSLRILKHVVEDVCRLVGVMTDAHLSNDAAMSEVIPLFVALNIEVRDGKLAKEDLRKRYEQSFTYELRSINNKGEAKPPIVNSQARFPNVDFDSTVLDDEMLVSALIRGRYAQEDVARSLDGSVHFSPPEDLPPWRVIIGFRKLSSSTVDKAVERMNELLSKSKIVESGEILHSFALKLFMAEEGVEVGTLKSVEKEAKGYIDKLRSDNLLAPKTADLFWLDDFSQSYDGQGYYVTEKAGPTFDSIKKHLIRARELSLIDRFPTITKELLKLMAGDAREFLERVSPTNNGPNPYASISLLHYVPVNSFVDEWLSAPEENWSMIGYAIENRYEHGRLERDHPDEKVWAKELLDELERRMNSAKGWDAVRIKSIIPKVLRPLKSL